MHQLLADLREQRCIRELEEKEAGRKGKKTMVLEESGAANPLRFRSVGIGSPTRPAEVNVGTAYAGKRKEQWDSQRGGYQENIAGGQKIPDGTHDRSCCKAADGGEALVATQSFSECVVPNQRQTDGGDAWSEDASGCALHDGRRGHGWEVRSQPENQ